MIMIIVIMIIIISPIIQYSKSRLKTKAQPESLVWNLPVLFKYRSPLQPLPITHYYISYPFGLMIFNLYQPEHVEDAGKVVRVSGDFRHHDSCRDKSKKKTNSYIILIP